MCVCAFALRIGGFRRGVYSDEPGAGADHLHPAPGLRPGACAEAAVYLLKTFGTTENARQAMEWLRSKRDEPKQAAVKQAVRAGT
jgi:hypothetical protein